MKTTWYKTIYSDNLILQNRMMQKEQKLNTVQYNPWRQWSYNFNSTIIIENQMSMSKMEGSNNNKDDNYK